MQSINSLKIPKQKFKQKEDITYDGIRRRPNDHTTRRL